MVNSTSTTPITRSYGQGTVLYFPTNVGMAYWSAFNNRTPLLNTLRTQLTPVLPNPQIIQVANTTSSLGVANISSNVYYDIRGDTGFVFVDLNSYEVAVTVAPSTTYFKLVWPFMMPVAVKDRTKLNISGKQNYFLVIYLFIYLFSGFA